jgi:excisionase family DNA binding protein
MTPLVHSIPEVCSLAGAGRTSVYKAINCGKLIAHKRGARTLIFASDLRQWLHSLPQIEAKLPTQRDAVSGAAIASSNIADGDTTERKPRSKA